jgi:hypothetical protein
LFLLTSSFRKMVVCKHQPQQAIHKCKESICHNNKRKRSTTPLSASCWMVQERLVKFKFCFQAILLCYHYHQQMMIQHNMITSILTTKRVHLITNTIPQSRIRIH